jgi:hypothetical protein
LSYRSISLESDKIIMIATPIQMLKENPSFKKQIKVSPADVKISELGPTMPACKSFANKSFSLVDGLTKSLTNHLVPKMFVQIQNNI